jgi:hypothetical protein
MSNAAAETSLFQYLRQDDSKLIQFKTNGLSAFGITGETLNVRHLNKPYIEIVLSSSNSSPIYFNMECGEACSASVDLGKISNDWETKTIPLSCLDAQGFDISKISIRGMFIAPQKTDLRIHTLKLKSNFSGINNVEGC